MIPPTLQSISEGHIEAVLAQDTGATQEVTDDGAIWYSTGAWNREGNDLKHYRQEKQSLV
jgi:hypothetical protein